MIPFQLPKRLMLLIAVYCMLFKYPAVALAQGMAAPPSFLSTLFTDNMVLQRGQADPIWGWTTPGAVVKVTILGKSWKTVAAADGKWLVKVGPVVSANPFEVVVAGPQKAVLHNVVCGDVWLCTGQSNMEFGIMEAIDRDKEIADSNQPDIRFFTSPFHSSSKPCAVVNGYWSVCSPSALVEQGSWYSFTAVGYKFGKELNQTLHVPIGLIHACIGATGAPTWSRPQDLETMPEFRDVMEKRKAPGNVGYDSYDDIEQWFVKNDPGSAGGYPETSPTLDTSSWTTVSVPKDMSSVLRKFQGILWFHKTLSLTAAQAASPAVLHLGCIGTDDRVWVNGSLVGSSLGMWRPRVYHVPAGVLKAGANVIAIRVYWWWGSGGLIGEGKVPGGLPDALTIKFDGADPVSLAGDWQYAVTLPDYTKVPPRPADLSKNEPSCLYNGMIAPLVGFGIKGVIWHQIAGAVPQYRTLLPNVINGWRESWAQGPFPFYVVQHESWQPRKPGPIDRDGDTDIREVQRWVSHTIPNTGMAVTYDIGDVGNAHPKDKTILAHRLALIALAKTYGKNVEYSGPDFTYADPPAAGKMVLHFRHVGKGLTALPVTTIVGQDPLPGDKLYGFQIAGDDHKWVWGDAQIAGDTVVVSSLDVPSPTTVRYAWSLNPPANLYNIDGLPAPPFRTDGPVSETGNER